MSSMISKSRSKLLSAMAFTTRQVPSLPVVPMVRVTSSGVMGSLAPAHSSKRLTASRIPPWACLAMRRAASSERSISSSRAILWRRAQRSAVEMRRKSKRWQREMMVAGSFCSSVVARIKTTCSGGSSRVFSRALKAEAESICTSSMM